MNRGFALIGSGIGVAQFAGLRDSSRDVNPLQQRSRFRRYQCKWLEVDVSQLLDVYNEIVVALRAEDDEITRRFFDPEFVVYEDPGMPYGGILHGPDSFITLRRKVRKFWDLAFIAKCVEPNGDRLVAVFNATGVPGSAVDGLETVVTVVWTFRDGKAVEARVLYYDTPRLSLALAKAEHSLTESSGIQRRA